MYELDDVLAAPRVRPGTNLLVTGSPMAGKRMVGLDVLAAGTDRGEGAIVVTTTDGAAHVLSQYVERADLTPETPIGVVDCVSRHQGIDPVTDDRVSYAASPVDMTTIGVELSSYLESFSRERGLRRNRVLVHSLSTLLMYAELGTVFRFVHVLTGRLQSAGALGLCVIDSTTHDDRTMNTLKQLFDGVVAVEESGEPRLLGPAFSDLPRNR
ncbi:RAD55 family ATPase [Natronorarus salvus]|uniref:RAD55 family ATPase n=1 Tax=Natronorarus salvus TaxID=3117733 RepID=UPI002F26A81B